MKLFRRVGQKQRCAPRPTRGGCGRPASSDCGPGGNDLGSFAAIVADYLRHYRSEVTRSKAYFGDSSLTPKAVVERACLSIDYDGRLHGHQRRRGRAHMAEIAELMRVHVQTVTTAPNFAETYERVLATAGRYPGIGELTVYDIAQRIGWYRGFEPEEVYLHCGTRDGARILVRDLRGNTISVDRLPAEFRTLTPAQIEDVLCIYKAQIQKIVSRMR